MFPPIDVLLMGHVTVDEAPDGPRLGGTVTFSALTALALGLRAGIVTSAPDELTPGLAPLTGIAVQRVPSAQPTTFINHYTAAGRQQVITGRASPLTWHDIPAEWRAPAMVHFAPVADEIDPDTVARFPSSFVGLTPQGWMRGWDETGRVYFRGWKQPATLSGYASAVVLSIEDIEGDEALAQEIADQCRVMVITRAAGGCTLFVDGSPQPIPAVEAREIDPTGAGDIFAMAFFARLNATGSPQAAARFASRLASYSVTRPGLDSVPTRQEINRALEVS